MPLNSAHARGDRYRVTRLDDESVNEYYRRNPSLGNAFDRPTFLHTLANSFGREVVHLGLERENSLAAIASLLVQRIGPLGNAQSLPIRYTGLESTNSRDIPAQILSLRRWLGSAKRRIGRVHYSFPPGADFDTTKLEGAGVSLKIAETCVLDLHHVAAESGVPDGANRRMKERLRHTWRQGVVVRDARPSDVVDVLPRLLESTYARNKGVSPYPPGFASLLWNRHGHDPAFVIRTAHMGEETNVVGLAIGIGHNQIMYSFIIARDNEHEESQRLNVNGVLIADMARCAKASGYRHYDLGGGTDGIIEFKTHMGARRETYANVTANHLAYSAAFGCWESLKRSRGWRLPSKPWTNRASVG